MLSSLAAPNGYSFGLLTRIPSPKLASQHTKHHIEMLDYSSDFIIFAYLLAINATQGATVCEHYLFDWKWF